MDDTKASTLVENGFTSANRAWLNGAMNDLSASGSRLVDFGESLSTKSGPGHCAPDFNCDARANFQDVFDFVAAWFAASPTADFNGASGVSVQDIFDYLAAWFVGCP